MGLQVDLLGVSIRERLATLWAFHWLVTVMQLPDLYVEVTLAAAVCGTQLTLVDRLGPGGIVSQHVRLHGVPLSEAFEAYLTLVRALPSVDA